MVGHYSTAYHSSSDSNCKFSDTVANVPEHTLTAKPVASNHQVGTLMLMMLQHSLYCRYTKSIFQEYKN